MSPSTRQSLASCLSNMNCQTLRMCHVLKCHLAPGLAPHLCLSACALHPPRIQSSPGPDSVRRWSKKHKTNKQTEDRKGGESSLSEVEMKPGSCVNVHDTGRIGLCVRGITAVISIWGIVMVCLSVVEMEAPRSGGVFMLHQ